MYLDSHAHYDDSRFDPDRDELLSALPASGVGAVINCGCDVTSSLKSLALAKKYPHVYCAVGTHPESADKLTQADLALYRQLAQEEKCVAIGEIGLDYHYPDGAPREVQQAAFRAQLELAAELKKPVIVHDRDAHGDALALACEFTGQVTGVFHCFAGSVETARELLKRGWYLGFTGAITFKNARRAAEVIEFAPLDRLLLETDCPYMAPEPQRGRRCDSRMLSFTCRKMAEIRRLDPEQVALRTSANARRLFGLPEENPAPGCKSANGLL